MSYVPSTPAQRQEMLRAVGVEDYRELYRDVPEEMLLDRELNLPSSMSELEVSRTVSAMAARNTQFATILRGAGAYDHYIPALVKSIPAKEEFLTAYTPYQAEMSQGVLQSIFEYQTEICELTGMDVSNASVYDGASAAAEAVFMCQERKKSSVVFSGTVNPQVLRVVKTYCESRQVPVTVIPPKGTATDLEALKAAIADDTAAVYVQSPNYYGVIEDMDAVVEAAHAKKAKVIMGCNPIALGLLKTPGEYGADIAVGEGQPLGMPLAFGGPYLGFMTCKQAMMRKLPGRIVGETADHDGNRAYVLTLQAREQHIRREKASSNICSNQALCAMTASVYLAAMGPKGLRQAAESSAAHAHYLADQIAPLGFGRKDPDQPFFHEFLTECPMDPDELCKKLEPYGILGGLPVDGGILWCCTECNDKADIDRLVAALKEVCGK